MFAVNLGIGVFSYDEDCSRMMFKHRPFLLFITFRDVFEADLSNNEDCDEDKEEHHIVIAVHLHHIKTLYLHMGHAGSRSLLI
jgi:hypothetical protein